MNKDQNKAKGHPLFGRNTRRDTSFADVRIGPLTLQLPPGPGLDAVTSYEFACPHCGRELEKFMADSNIPPRLSGPWISRCEPVDIALENAEGWISSGDCPDCAHALASISVGQWRSQVSRERSAPGFRLQAATFCPGFVRWCRVDAVSGAARVVTDQFPLVLARNLADRTDRYWAILDVVFPSLRLPNCEILSPEIIS